MKRTTETHPKRRGIVVVLTAFLLCVVFAFVSLSIDSGRVVLTETQMQNAVDAAALAASQEITAAVYEAGQQGGSPGDANSIAISQARLVAADVAARNGVFIDPDTDVSFGKRGYDAASDSWPIQWGAAPFNVVRVAARRDNSDLEAPDGEFPLAFGWALNKESVPITTSATAFVEARDLVLVLDHSGSMNDDSSLNSALDITQVEASLDNMWAELQDADPTWPGTTKSKFPATGFGKIDSAAGTYISSSDTSTIRYYLDLNDTDSNGDYEHKFPQSGRNSSGTPYGEPSNYSSRNLWDGYINYVKNLSGPYRKKYGYRTLLSYLQNSRPRWTQSEDLWRTSHYPYTAVKNGASLFLGFLNDLDFGDEVGVVSYATWAEWEDSHYDGELSINISDDPITASYDVIDTIQRRHQAAHYDSRTGVGDGILKGRRMLVGADNDPNDDGHSRYGARPTMILMTDGLANESKSGWSMPSGFNWADWTDYDGDGTADYSTNDQHKKYAFWEATQCVERGITIHTMAVGVNADHDLMRAIAFAGGGVYISVPGGSTIAEMEDQMLEAFSQIAAKVPPAQLVYELGAE